jgi:inosine-uridine nucleoside N-ribohydrolase
MLEEMTLRQSYLPSMKPKKDGKKIIGITCIDGNATLDDVAINVLICISLCGENIPVYKGKQGVI